MGFSNLNIMKVLVIVSLLLAAALAEEGFLTLQEYNEAHDSETKIIAGSAASVGQFPYQVAVQYRTSNGNYFCGGSLISDRWVLTAAHCSVGVIEYTLYLGGVTIGSSESGRLTVRTSSYITHEDYSSNTLNNDLALIHLPEAVTFNSRIQPVKLPSRNENLGTSVGVTVSGWGRTSDSSNSVSSVLNFVNLTTVSNADCARVYGNRVVVASTVCARGNPQHSTCNGDSGGPLVTYSNGVPTQVGVVSFVSSAGCASGNPSGYVRTASFVDWISRNTGLSL